MRSVKVAATIALLITAVACGETGEPPITVSGSITVSGTPTQVIEQAEGQPCQTTSSGGLADVSAGAPVSIKNSSGKQVAVGKLGDGYGGTGYNECRFDFSVEDVPRDSSYTVEIANRGAYAFKAADARGIKLTLGN